MKTFKNRLAHTSLNLLVALAALAMLTWGGVLLYSGLYPDLRTNTTLAVVAVSAAALICLALMIAKRLQGDAPPVVNDGVIEGWQFRCDGEMHTIFDAAEAARWEKQGFTVKQVEVRIVEPVSTPAPVRPRGFFRKMDSH